MSHGSQRCPEQPSGEVGHPDSEARRAQLGDEHAAGVRPEAQLTRCATARRRAEVAVFHQAAVDQLGEPLGDHRAAEPGPAAQLGPGADGTGAHEVEHGHERVELLGPEAEIGHRTRPLSRSRPPLRSIGY